MIPHDQMSLFATGPLINVSGAPKNAYIWEEDTFL
jgi:hypothetical protein